MLQLLNVKIILLIFVKYLVDAQFFGLNNVVSIYYYIVIDFLLLLVQDKLTWMQIISRSNGRQMSLQPIARRHPLYWCLEDRLILYGGVSEESVGSAHNLTDMWEFQFALLQWVQLPQDSGMPGMPNVTEHSVRWIDAQNHDGKNLIASLIVSIILFT